MMLANLLWVALGPQDAPPPAILLEVQLAAVASQREPGSPRTFTVTLVNRSKKTLHLMLPGDGSESHWRNPHIGWSVLPSAKGQHPNATPKYGMGRCGNVNSITADEFFDLAPGKSRALGGWLMPPSFGPGQHRVKFYYEIVADDKMPRGLAQIPMNEELVAKYRALTPVRASSNEVIVNVPVR